MIFEYYSCRTMQTCDGYRFEVELNFIFETRF